MLFDYWDQLGGAVEYVIATANVVFILGLVIGLAGVLTMGQFQRRHFIKMVIICFIGIGITGGFTVGIHYFRLHV